MENKDCKPWERPWSTDEISENSANWSLAGDAGLLKHLQQFSQILLERTHSSEVALNLLLDGMKATAVDISNVANTFLMLTNTQFVENRVYDDDDDDEKANISEALPQVKSKEEKVAENLTSVKKALTLGISVLDTMFDAVEVPASESEDEENSESVGRVVLQPRNTYVLQPLPCMIGSEEFIDDDTVGLAELLSDNEENVEHNILPSSSSGTSSDVEHEVTEADGSRHPCCALSSESENSEPESERSVPLGKKIFYEPTYKFNEIPEEGASDGAIFGRESPPEVKSVSGFSKPLAPVDFASELAAKLGGIPGETTSVARNDQSKGQDLFGTDDGLEDSLFGHNVRESKEGGLFDDFDQPEKPKESLWNSSLSNQSNSSVTTAQETTSNTSSSHIQPETSVPEKTKKKPVGGVSVLGMVKNSSVKISPYICRPPSTSSESDLNEDMKPQTDVSSVTNFSSEVSGGIGNLADNNERKTSLLDDMLHNEAFSSNSLFDTNEEDALFLPSSTPKQQNTQLETSQKRVVASSNQSDSSRNGGSVASKPAVLSRSSRPTPAAKSSSTRVLECSDSDEDKNLFSSTCSSISSRSSKSQVSNDFLAKTDKMAQKKELFPSSSMFGSDYLEEPTFDVFGSTVKNNSSRIENKRNDYDKERNPVSIIEGSKNIGKASSDLFESSDDVPDIFSVKSSIENIHSKEENISSQNLAGPQIDDFDDIFSAIKTSSKDNLFLFSTQKLDDDFDIFSSVVTVNTNCSSKNDDVQASKSSDESSNKSTESHVKILGESESQKVLTQSTDEVTDIFSQPLKPNPNIDLLFDSGDKASVDISINGSKNDFSSAETISSVVGTCNNSNNGVITHSRKEETVGIDQNRSLVKPEPPKSLNITKTADLVYKGASDDSIKKELESAPFRNNGPAKSLFKSAFMPSTATNVPISLPGSGSEAITKNSYSVADADNKMFNDEKRLGIERNTANHSNGASNFEASPRIPSSSSHTNINCQPLVSDTRSSPRGTSSETAVSFDSPACISSVLQSTVKERARIPVKRRPQSRKARKEALNASSLENSEVAIDASSVHSKLIFGGTENKLFSGKMIPGDIQENLEDPFPVLNLNNSVPESEVTSTGGSNVGNIFSILCNETKPFSPSTDEEDFFGVPSDLPIEYNNSKDTSGYKNEALFGNAPILSPIGVSSHEERNQKSSPNYLPSILKPSSSIQNKLMSSVSSVDSNSVTKSHVNKNLSSDAPYQLSKDVAISNTCSDNFSIKSSHHTGEPGENGDKSKTSSDGDYSEGDLFGTVDHTNLFENESDIFQTVPKAIENGKTNVKSVSDKNFPSSCDSYVTSINKMNKTGSSIDNCSEDKAHSQQQWFTSNTDTGLISSEFNDTLPKEKMFQNNEGEVNDLFSSDLKSVSSSHLFDELFSAQTKYVDQMFSATKSNPNLLSEPNEQHAGLDPIGSSTQVSNSLNNSEDEVRVASSTIKTKSVSDLKVKGKEKGIFHDHDDDDDDDDDISIFSSSRVAVAETSRASASPSRKTGSKSHGKIGENIARRKSLAQVSQSDGEKFEDPLKATK